jgi:hypothetical protein
MVQSNLAFEYVYDDAFCKPLICLFSITSFSTYFGVSCKQRQERPTLVELFSIKPYSSVDDHF